MRTIPTRAAAVASAAVVLAVAVAGCGGNDPAPTTTPTPPAPASATPRGPAALGVDQVVKVGDNTIKARVHQYRQPLKAEFPSDRPGREYAGVEVTTCFTTVGDAQVSWEPWRLAYADHTTLNPPSSWSDSFTVPLYAPDPRRVRSGDCLRGWVVFEAPRGQRPVRVEYAPHPGDGVPIGDGPAWTLR